MGTIAILPSFAVKIVGGSNTEMNFKMLPNPLSHPTFERGIKKEMEGNKVQGTATRLQTKENLCS